MKKILISIFLFFLSAGYVGAGAVVGGGYLGGAGCSDPVGDEATEGFEGSGSGGYELDACGSAPCWAETGSPDQAFALAGLSGGTGASQNCSYGVRNNASAALVFTAYDIDTGLAEVWVEFSFYIDTEGLDNTDLVSIMQSTEAANRANDMADVMIKDDSGTLKIYAQGGTATSQYAVSIDTWYYVQIHIKDSDTSYLSVGTTYNGTETVNNQSFAARNEGLQDLYEFGVGLYEDTMDITFGYVAIDDDGTFE